MALHGTKALEAWCKRITQGYDEVNIVNMSTSWRNGLGFCAIIHHFCPELIDFTSLDPDDVFGNNELAFSVAEQHLGVPSLLDPQDMVECELLDRLSILTYLAQYYQAFNSQTVQARVRRLGSVSKSSSTNSDLVDSAAPSPRSKLPPRIGKLNEPCRQCSKVVEIISRLNVGGRILHRTCFKCARCDTQLSLASYYETETGDFCCEVCPDEEKKEAVTLKANKDLANVMSADSGHSSEEETEHVAEVFEDQTATFGLKDTTNITISEVDRTDLNDNIPEECKNSETGSEGCEKSIEIFEHEKEYVHESNDSDLVESEESKSDISTEVNANDLGQNPSIGSVQDVTDNFDKKLSVNNNEDEEEEEFSDSGKITVTVVDENNPDEVEEEQYPDDMNPFGAEDEAETSPTVQASVDIIVEEETEKKIKEETTNPFGSDLESEEEKEDESAKVHQVSSASLNPFGSDLSDEEEASKSPSLSIRSTMRKKRRAPLPPGMTPIPAPRPSLGHAPAPLISQDTAHRGGTAKRLKDADNLHRRSQILESIQGGAVSPLSLTSHSTIPEDSISVASDTASLRSDTATTATRSSQLSVSMFSNMAPDKAEEGQWRKKKGPAPARPIPPKRIVKKLPRKAINQELMDIEVKQGELERQGVKLEKTIREICAANDAEEGANRDSLGPEAEDLIIQLFDLVNEKNELFRRQTELIYMKKENRLEEQHADCEYQIRVIMSKAECQRTEEDKKKEEKLIARLVEIVGLRNEIVDCLEMDRLRELDEDTAIEDHMSNYAAVKPVNAAKKGGLEKILKIKKRKKKDKDPEKDIDTSEVENQGAKPEKPKKKSAKKKILSLASKGLATSKQLAFSHKN